MHGGLITAVDRESLGSRVGLRPGDLLKAINGRPLHDVIDVRVFGSEDHLALSFSRGGADRLVEADRRYREPLGLEFAAPTFDGIRRCRNRCEFCFLDQMPPGLRPSLYVKDDDFRYSFLFGSYVTLTNLNEGDWNRIAAQRLTPLYVSVHATDPVLRRRMLDNSTAPDVLEQLRWLIEVGIDAHTQVVVVPGVNDGPVLARSIRDLAALYPGVRSLSVVPVGITRYHLGGCRPNTLGEMRSTAAMVSRAQRDLRKRLGVSFAYLSDEWYLTLGWPVPEAGAYDGLDLTQNGVGAARRFLDASDALVADLIGLDCPQTLVTGELFLACLRQLLLPHPQLRAIGVRNTFFGRNVTVAGLLTAQDVATQLAGMRLGARVVLPPDMFGGPEASTIDGQSAAEIGSQLGCPVAIGPRVQFEAQT